MSTQADEDWYYTDGAGMQNGPVTLAQMRTLVREGGITTSSLAWNPDYTDWVRVDQIADLLGMVKPPVTPPPVIQRQPIHIPPPAPMHELTPVSGPFLGLRMVITIGIAFIASVGLAECLILFEASALPAIAAFVGICALGFYTGVVAHRKERYEIHDDRLLCHRGGLFSDQTNELELRNVTHVKLRLPWLRHKFFGVGHVMVQSAGTSRPMNLLAIREPQAVYEELKERLQKNGFDLQKNQLLHEEKPALIGILSDYVTILFGAVMSLFLFLPMIIGISSQLQFPFLKAAIPAIMAVVVLIVLFVVVLRMIDLSKRTYRVFNDAVVYEEGFLTRNYAFIPYENIADSQSKRTLVDQILGLYDVIVSCQGSSSEIKFRRLKNGEALSNAIDQLVIDASRKPKAASTRSGHDIDQAQRICYRREEPDHVPAEYAAVADFKMHSPRVFVPLLLLLPLFPVWVAAMIQYAIQVGSTTFSTRPSSLRFSYSFLNTNIREFSYDKITGMVIKTNLWDRMFGTMTLKFWSIGSGQAMEFKHVHARNVDLPTLMRQVGIPQPSPDPYQAKAAFSVITWMRASFWLVGILLLLVLHITVIAILTDPWVFAFLILPFGILAVAMTYTKLHIDRQSLGFHEHHVEARQGVIDIKRFFVRYRHIKRLKVTRYPGGEDGSLEIFIAGEEVNALLNAQQQQNSQMKGYLKQCSFVSKFLLRAEDVGQVLDGILCGRVAPTPHAVPAEALEPLILAPRSAKNAVIKLVMLSLILFPLIVLLPISVPLMIRWVKRWRYEVDPVRIMVRYGILSRHSISTLLDRVDSLQKTEGPIHKLCHNGNVTIMTAGSSKPDLVIADTPDFRQLYDVIRDHTQ